MLLYAIEDDVFFKQCCLNFLQNYNGNSSMIKPFIFILGTEYAVCSSKEEAQEKCVQGIRLSLQDIKSWFSTEISKEGQVIYQCTECAEYRSPFPVKLRRHLERKNLKTYSIYSTSSVNDYKIERCREL